jgi:Outer membrane protein beta-barrel domain
MKNIFLTIALVLITITSKAQEFSYGVLLGANIFESTGDGERNVFVSSSGNSIFVVSGANFILNYGGYVEYNFNQNLGVKIESNFNRKAVKYFNSTQEFKMSFFEIAPSLKFDFGQEYRKGFYMLLGPKFSTMTSATYEGEDVISSFNKSRTSLQLGFGTRIKRIVDFETKFDYEFTPFFETTQNRKSNFFNVYHT